MESANHDWTNQFLNISVCEFPDCINESRCQCTKCMCFYCPIHLQVHFGFCNNLNDQKKYLEDAGASFQLIKVDDEIEQIHGSRNLCLL